MANQPMMNVTAVTGMTLRSAPMRRMSCSLCMPWMTAPDPRNSSALKNAWVIMWKIAAVYAPDPTARNMYPSWLTVEYASTFLMSFWATAIVAANNAVAAPTIAIKVGAYDDATFRIGLMRHIRNTPAVTIVAAWINADTGVGPSIASGSHRYNGSCALLPQAPMKQNSAIAVAVVCAMVAAAPLTPM